jgi:hypothetical protein
MKARVRETQVNQARENRFVMRHKALAPFAIKLIFTAENIAVMKFRKKCTNN